MSVLPSVASQVPYRIAIGAGCSLGVAALATFLTSPQSIQAPVEVPAIAAPAPVPAPTVLPIPEPPAPAPEAHANQLMFVFQAGGTTYMKLADLRLLDQDGDELPVPRHGKLRFAEDDNIEAAIAPVADRDVPVMHLTWKDRKVKVDDGCEASVVGFAVVSRIVGDSTWADLKQWTATGVMKAGHIVLAAKLDGCPGSFARDATLPDIVIPAQLHDPALEKAATAALLASEPARETQREWDKQTSAIGSASGPWHKDASMATEVLRHPRTGVTFVSVHGHVMGGCGDPQANVWGLFRVDGDKLVPVQLRKLDEIETLDALIDVDGDGKFEILGRPWLPYDTLLIHANGEPLDQLSVPFLGCPC